MLTKSKNIFWLTIAVAAGEFTLVLPQLGRARFDSRVILTKPASDARQVKFTAEVRAVREVVDPLDLGTDRA